VEFKGKTTVSVLHDAQLLLNKQQQIWGDIYICCFFVQCRCGGVAHLSVFSPQYTIRGSTNPISLHLFLCTVSCHHRHSTEGVDFSPLRMRTIDHLLESSLFSLFKFVCYCQDGFAVVARHHSLSWNRPSYTTQTEVMSWKIFFTLLHVFGN